MISFSDFQKLDLRVGEIKGVFDVDGYDKLYRLKVDLGQGEVRTLVAGIKSKYSKEELVDWQVVIVANLEPKEIAGVESQGMLLAAVEESSGSDKGQPVLLMPCERVQPGAKVR